MKKNILIFLLLLFLYYIHHKTLSVLNPERVFLNRWYEKSIKIGRRRVSESSKSKWTVDLTAQQRIYYHKCFLMERLYMEIENKISCPYTIHQKF